MSINAVGIGKKAGGVNLFVKEMPGAGGAQQSYVNIDNIADIRYIRDNFWEATGKYGQNKFGGPIVYHFDNQGAQQIINYMA